MIYRLSFIAGGSDRPYNIDVVNPYIRVAMNSVLCAGTSIKRRVIFDYELIYVERGEFTLHYNELDYIGAPGQFILLRPGIPHSFKEIKQDLSQPHIHFDMIYSETSSQIPISFKDIGEFTAEERNLIHKDIFEDYPQTPLVGFSDKQKALKLFYSVIRDPSSKLAQKAGLIQLIDMLVSDNFPDCFSNKENVYNIAQQVKDYIDAGQGLTAQLNDLERQFSYSKYHMERQFKKMYGKSLIAYRNEKRLQTAETLLQGHTVSFVSEILGYTSIYTFSRAFKQHFGLSPSAFQREKQQKNNQKA